MDHINMDNKKYPNATVPQLEFTLPNTELDEQVVTGEIGKITIPVEVLENNGKTTTFRKRHSVEMSQFEHGTLKDMEDHLSKEYPDMEDK